VFFFVSMVVGIRSCGVLVIGSIGFQDFWIDGFFLGCFCTALDEDEKMIHAFR